MEASEQIAWPDCGNEWLLVGSLQSLRVPCACEIGAEARYPRTRSCPLSLWEVRLVSESWNILQSRYLFHLRLHLYYSLIILAFWEKSAQFRKHLRKVSKQMARCSIRPYPIDLYLNRERCSRLEYNYFIFKNGVIRALRKLRHFNRKSFLQNLKSELLNRRRKEVNQQKREEFIHKSLSIKQSGSFLMPASRAYCVNPNTNLIYCFNKELIRLRSEKPD